MSDKYNGWTNYETWNVALWIGNEQGTSEEAERITNQCVKDAPYASQVPKIWTAQEAAKLTLADALKEWVESDMIPDLGASMAADLLGAAMSEVNWQEIAENYLDDCDEYKELASDEAAS